MRSNCQNKDNLELKVQRKDDKTKKKGLDLNKNKKQSWRKLNFVFNHIKPQNRAYNNVKLMQAQSKQSFPNGAQMKKQQSIVTSPNKNSTLGSLIEQISFEVRFLSIEKKKKTKLIKKTTWSDTSSISSSQSIDFKQKSKLWTEQENEKFLFLLKKHGPDFQLLGQFFDKKSKNQLKNKYKEYLINQKKKAKQQDNRLRALSLLFKEVDQKQQEN